MGVQEIKLPFPYAIHCVPPGKRKDQSIVAFAHEDFEVPSATDAQAPIYLVHGDQVYRKHEGRSYVSFGRRAVAPEVALAKGTVLRSFLWKSLGTRFHVLREFIPKRNRNGWPGREMDAATAMQELVGNKKGACRIVSDDQSAALAQARNAWGECALLVEGTLWLALDEFEPHYHVWISDWNVTLDVTTWASAYESPFNRRFPAHEAAKAKAYFADLCESFAEFHPRDRGSRLVLMPGETPVFDPRVGTASILCGILFRGGWMRSEPDGTHPPLFHEHWDELKELWQRWQVDRDAAWAAEVDEAYQALMSTFSRTVETFAGDVLDVALSARIAGAILEGEMMYQAAEPPRVKPGRSDSSAGH